MATLTSLIPDVDVLVSIATEEVAEVVLRLADEHKQNNLVHLQFIASQINGTPGANNGYPQNRRKDAELAIAEAWNWLLVQGLLIPEPGINGTSGFMLLLLFSKVESYSRILAFGLLEEGADQIREFLDTAERAEGQTFHVLFVLNEAFGDLALHMRPHLFIRVELW